MKFISSRMRILFFLLLSVGIGCTPKLGASPGSSSQAPGSKVVNLAIWSNYLSAEIFADFEKKTGIKLHISNYSSNEELLAKLQAGASGYDVVMPTDYMVYAMIKLGLLKELDLNQLPNAKLSDPKYTHKSYDPQGRYSVPYDWGTTGIAIHHSLYPGRIKGWKDLFTRPDLAGKVSLLDDSREVIGAALKALGYSLNSRNPDELEKAKKLILDAKPRIKVFTSEPLMPIENGEIAVSHIFMSDALQARKATGGKIEYIVPEEGGTFWIDTLVIPQGAQHVTEAHQLINYLLDAKANAATVMSVFVAPVNRETYGLLPKDLQQNTLLFPTAATLAKCEMIEDLGEFGKTWDRVWTEIKAARE